MLCSVLLVIEFWKCPATSKIVTDTRHNMNESRGSWAFLQSFRILLKKLLKKSDAKIIVMVCLFEN